MTFLFIHKFKLAGSRGDGRRAYVNDDGAFIGRGVPLLEQDALGRWKPRDKGLLERLLGIGYGVPVELNGRYMQLRDVAQALNEGNLALAGISLVHMRLPPLPSAEHARDMAKADGLMVKYNPDWEDQPRVPAGNPDGGQWTSEGGGASDETAHAETEAADIEPAAYRGDDTQEKKELFIDTHLADAQKIASRLDVPVENILGISALESDWGEHRFATEGNNYFGIHWPAPFATGFMSAKKNPKVKVATFASHADSARSFAAISASYLLGIADPHDFAAALHQHGFGVGTRNYVRDLAATIRGLQQILSRRRI
jgi:hypothetical protein